ncbi:DNA-binding transcriptional MerR regulator [Bacillus sp. RC206]
MSKKEGYSIGEFSKRTGISIRTLQYYDELGLLKPEKI